MDSSEPFRVMIVDDSTVIRGLVTRVLDADSQIKVVSSVADGQMAVSALARHPVDVIVLDIEMPVMDGIEAIPKLLAVNPGVKIIMSSTLTMHNAEISMKALSLGAHDYVAKPTSTKDMSSADDFKRELVEKVKALGNLARRGGAVHLANETKSPPIEKLPQHDGPVTLLTTPITHPDIIAIGSSTGGPQALFAVLKELKGLRQPIVITQHMPATFTTILAQHISGQAGVPCEEGKDGMKVEGGKAYLAPGDYHMTFTGMVGDLRIALNKNPPENFCRPAVDPMLRSLAAIYGKRVLVAILTGMGSDGALGAKNIVDAGGTVVAQDEASSVVWGMPAAVAKAGLCHAVLPLNGIGQWLRQQAEKVG